jgi:hypothetical protein
MIESNEKNGGLVKYTYALDRRQEPPRLAAAEKKASFYAPPPAGPYAVFLGNML